jgi:hypothetical protein
MGLTDRIMKLRAAAFDADSDDEDTLKDLRWQVSELVHIASRIERLLQPKPELVQVLLYRFYGTVIAAEAYLKPGESTTVHLTVALRERQNLTWALQGPADASADVVLGADVVGCARMRGGTLPEVDRPRTFDFILYRQPNLLTTREFVASCDGGQVFGDDGRDGYEIDDQDCDDFDDKEHG